ncbi:PREDICTED: uncharacterized protein LOC105454037 [Wasmannia auropunctata]|uniref:uncharacterized protein LOC105454037 n=1 Tax=Wasmannia auropunctata TaxID=64793 RepID=UPI0005EE9F0A|nr:PREDICTED: uncharacterized protein LOC105454037 [Wasmannia auropunctata]
MENVIDSITTVCPSVEYGLRLIGVWPGTSCAILLKFLSILSMIVFQIFQYQHAIVRFGVDDLTLLMDALSVTFAYTLLLIKMLIFAFNSRLLNEIIARMAKDWKECDISDGYTMTRIAYVCRWVCNVIIFSHMMSVFLYAVGTLMKIKNENQTEARELLIKMEIPFAIESTSVHVAVLITQFIHQVTAAAMVGVVNSLLIILVLHVCGQIDIMRQKLSEITQKNIERKNIGQGVRENVVKTLIVRHQQIITFSKNIEALYSNIALIQFGTNTLQKTAYELLWYELSPSQNQDIQIIIVRSQRHLTLTIGKVAELSLKQFANIIKASASYVSVLHAMY